MNNSVKILLLLLSASILNTAAAQDAREIVRKADEKARGRATTPTTPAAASNTPAANNPNKTAEKLNYAIQLGSFSQINFKSFGNVADLGDLTAERADNNTKMYLGTYTSRSDADRILSIVKQRGYTAAFIKTIPIAEK